MLLGRTASKGGMAVTVELRNERYAEIFADRDEALNFRLTKRSVRPREPRMFLALVRTPRLYNRIVKL